MVKYFLKSLQNSQNGLSFRNLSATFQWDSPPGDIQPYGPFAAGREFSSIIAHNLSSVRTLLRLKYTYNLLSKWFYMSVNAGRVFKYFLKQLSFKISFNKFWHISYKFPCIKSIMLCLAPQIQLRNVFVYFNWIFTKCLVIQIYQTPLVRNVWR